MLGTTSTLWCGPIKSCQGRGRKGQRDNQERAGLKASGKKRLTQKKEWSSA